MIEVLTVEDLVARMRGETARFPCPVCSPNRKPINQKEPVLALRRTPDGTVYKCFHCDYQGIVIAGRARRSEPPTPTIIMPTFTTEQDAWLEKRGISKETAEKARLQPIRKYFKGVGETEGIAFPYYNLDGELASNKYRACKAKEFTADPGGKSLLWGLHQAFDKSKALVITEGEMDAISLMEAGIPNAVSVPSGAPATTGGDNSNRLGWLVALESWVKEFPAFILATDSDAPGKALREELARRLGRSRCLSVEYPEGKDANDVLAKRGRPSLIACITHAEPMPVSGLFSAASYFDDFMELCSGTGKGYSTGYESVDQLFTVAPGQMTVLTGVPSSGKSNWDDQLNLNLVRTYDWRIALASMENPPAVHLAKIARMVTGKQPFSGRLNSMSPDERKRFLEWASEYYHFIDLSRSSESSTLDSILDRAEAAVFRHGIKKLTIDPFTHVEHDRKSDSETEWIGKMLSRLTKFAKAVQIHVTIVAHPNKPAIMFGPGKAPGGYDISASANWYNHADVGMTVHRRDDQGPGQVDINIWKCRHDWTGKQGSVRMQWEAGTGRYLA